MRINHNIAALNTYRQLSTNGANTSKSLEKLSSGLRINRAGDDAAGLAISEKMRGQIRGLDQASRNSQDAISLIQTAEGALNETHSILQRMRELAVQSASDTQTNDDRIKIQSEVDQLAKEITRISNTTEFNTKNLLAGGLSSTFHIGANKDQFLNLTIGAMDAQTLGVAGSLVTTTTVAGASAGTLSITTQSQSLNGLYINTKRTDATAVAGFVSGTGAAGNLTFTGPTLFNGSADETLQIKITATGTAATGDASAAMISSDGGATWSNIAVTNGGGASDSTITYKGVTLTFADVANRPVTAGNESVYSATFNAGYLDVQLGTANGTNSAVGTTAKLYNNMSSVIVGDAATDRVATVAVSNYSTAFGAITTAYAAANTLTVSQNLQASSKAVTAADGSVTTEADTKKGINVSSQGSSNNAITTINNAITTVSSARSSLGAIQNRLEHTIANLGTSSENLSAAESRVRDVDMAKEMMEFTKNNILSQAAQAMLAQANQQPQGVLQLLR